VILHIHIHTLDSSHWKQTQSVAYCHCP
jgi:hypothetical protein